MAKRKEFVTKILLDFYMGCVIMDGILDGLSAREIP